VRTEAATRLAAGATAELAGLAMPDARLLVTVAPRPAAPEAPDALRVGDATLAAGADGVDEVELKLIAHGGAQPQPLHKGASGGELSRVMLALEVALAGADPVPTMVFDEVDAGVGGRAAVEIGRRLARLAARHQVIVVTHLPQVAAYADRHLVVDKTSRGGSAAGNGSGRTSSRVRTLAEGDRIVELARMLAGLDDTDTGRAHAEELLGAARAHREADRAELAGPAPAAANGSASSGRAHKAGRKVPARG
jgi:DNA repair protein RecN (Recombination protein N)